LPITLFQKEKKPYEGESEISDDPMDKLNVTQSSTISRSNSMILGYKPMKIDQLERSGNYLLQFINFHIPKANLRRFPTDIIIGHGNLIFALIRHLYGSLDDI